MILFTLRCASGHEFEGVVPRRRQVSRRSRSAGEIACPHCGDSQIEKAVMAPNIGRSRDKAPPISPAQMRAALTELRRQVETNCDYVGERFAEEARRIHYGEADPHGSMAKRAPKNCGRSPMKASSSAASPGSRPTPDLPAHITAASPRPYN